MNVKRLFAIGVIIFSALIAPIRSQQAQAVDYMLDDSLGHIALYPGLFYRSYVAPNYGVPSLEELERRVGQLPPGTKLHWDPYKRGPSGKPILFSDGQYDHFAKFCRDHKIELLISPSQPEGRLAKVGVCCRVTGNAEVSWNQVPAKSGYRQLRLLASRSFPKPRFSYTTK